MEWVFVMFSRSFHHGSGRNGLGRAGNLLPVLFFALAVLLTAGCSKDKQEKGLGESPTPREVLEKGVQELNAGNLDAALSAFGLIVEKSVPGTPERPIAYSYLGHIAYQAGNMDLAISNFEAALAEAPNLVQVRLSLGNAYYSKKSIDRAREVWESLVADNPGLVAAQFNLGILHLDQGEPDKAIKYFEAVIALNPDHDQAHLNLARAFRKKGDVKAAEAAERKARAIQERRAAAAAARQAAPEGEAGKQPAPAGG